MDHHDSAYLLKMVHATDSKCESNSDRSSHLDYIGSGGDHVLSFAAKDIESLRLVNSSDNPHDKTQNGRFLLPSCGIVAERVQDLQPASVPTPIYLGISLYANEIFSAGSHPLIPRLTCHWNTLVEPGISS